MLSLPLPRASSPFLLAAALAFARPASADRPTVDPKAVSLFEEGRNLLVAGKYAEACPKFEESVKITRSEGALLNLADCYEKVGKTASAWTTFQQAEAFARDTKDVRAQIAHERAAALEPKVLKLTITVDPAADVPGLVVKRDGNAVGKSDLGQPVPVDPGKHSVDASAPGKQPWSSPVDVIKESGTVVVPALTDAAPTPAATVPTSRTAPARDGKSQRTIGLAVGGVGVAALAVGGVAGVLALNDLSKAQNACTSYPSHCSPDHSADDPNSAAKTWATVSTIGFAVAGVAIAAAIVLYLTAPKKPSSSLALHLAPAVGPRTGGVSLGGSF